MATGALIAAVIVGGLTCPAIMWWQRRRGRQPLCCPSKHEPRGRGGELEELRQNQASLSARLAQACLQGGAAASTAHREREEALPADGPGPKGHANRVLSAYPEIHEP